MPSIRATGTPAGAPPVVTPRWRAALAVFAVAFLVYTALAGWVGRTKSPTMAYYPALAEAFAQGRLHLGNPDVIRDLTPYDGVWYLAFPPLPALFMLPEAWLQGAEGVNAVRYATAFGAAAAMFVFLLLDALSRRGWTRLSTADNLWLTGLFAFGSVALYVSLAGTVWLTSQIVAVAFVAAAAWLAVDASSPLLPGAALALAVLARAHLAFVWPFLFGLALESRRGRAALRWAVASLAPLAVAALLLLAYNQARFDDPFDFGYATMAVSPVLAEEFARYGQFDLHYAPRNLRWMLFGLPVWDETCRSWTPSPWGTSLLLTMPALVFLARARPRGAWRIGAWTAIGLSLVPLLLYHNTGYYQFGYRFALDFLVPVVALLAGAAGERLTRAFRSLIVVGLAVNFAGMAWFFEKWCAP